MLPPYTFTQLQAASFRLYVQCHLTEIHEGRLSALPPSKLSSEALRLSDYIAGARQQNLPPQVVTKTKQHILDTLAAIISGSRLRAGELAAGYVGRIGGAQEASVLGTNLIVPAASAALANGMAGHGDETDDSHLGGRFHPGCGIVPAALAIAEKLDRGGRDVINAVALGYDIGARTTMALYPDGRGGRHSTHSLAPAFGAAAAAAALHKFDAQHVRYVLSYAVQQASGVPYWNRDSEHVEKAFDFGGMAARNGVSAAGMVAAGFSGVEDPFSGRDNFFAAFGQNPDPGRLAAELGTRFEIMQASIKKWCVGSPNQAVLDAVTALMGTHNIGADDAKSITITMPSDRIHIVDNGAMPDVCVQHLASLALLDGGVTFASCHDHDRMHDSSILAVRSRIRMIPSDELTAAVPARQAIVEIETKDGRKLRHHAKAVRGTPDNPMTGAEIDAKARDLIEPIVGPRRAEALVTAVGKLEEVRSVRELRPLLQA
jgi:2-methylcitrate dehydratase PrpD